jgi:hypothetical protein
MSARSGAFVSTLTTLGERKSRDNNHAAEPDTTAAGSLISLSTGPVRSLHPGAGLVPGRAFTLAAGQLALRCLPTAPFFDPRCSERHAAGDIVGHLFRWVFFV